MMQLLARRPISSLSTWYVLTGESGKILLDMEIHPNGRRMDYLKLDAF
jgi:hypothetical protein